MSLTLNIKGFHNGVAEDLNLLEFYAVLTGKYRYFEGMFCLYLRGQI